MSSNDPVAIQFQSSLQNDMDDDDHDDQHHRHHRHSLSRLSVCTNSTVCDDDDDDDVDYGMARSMSGLSIESLELQGGVEVSESEKESSNGRAIIGTAVKEKKGMTRQETWRRKCKRMMRSKSEDDDDEEEDHFAEVGRRSMDLDEMKGCRDLGFDLELDNKNKNKSHSRLSASYGTSSGGATSPISNWRISSPGDDPRDVKARLKMWAHAVAAASTSI